MANLLQERVAREKAAQGVRTTSYAALHGGDVLSHDDVPGPGHESNRLSANPNVPPIK